MLKLLKYEWKACARICLPLCGGLLLMSLVTRLMTTDRLVNLLNGAPAAVMTMLYVSMIVAVLVVVTVLLLQRFYKSLLGDEGYLMFTLPVTVGQHIWAKTIIATVMTVLSLIAVVASVCVLGIGYGLGEGLRQFAAEVTAQFAREPHSFFWMLELLVWALLKTVAGTLFTYLCIALGHLAKKHRLLMATVWFFVLTTAVQFVLMLVLTTGVVALPVDGIWAALRGVVNTIGANASIHLLMLGLCLGTAVIPGAVCFAGTRYILKNHLNLE